MKRFVLAAVCAAVPAAAWATEQSELLGCFEALSPVSQGFGASIRQWEGPPSPDLATVVVPGNRGRAEGLYVYSEDDVYFVDFAAAPPWPAYGAALRWFPFAFGPLRPGRGIFQCSYLAQKGVEQREVTCDFGDFLGDATPPRGKPAPRPGEKYYYPVAVKRLPATSAERAALRTAVLSRIMSVTAVFAKTKAKKYGEALERHKRRLAEGPNGLVEALGTLGMDFDWNREPPSRPDRSRELKALGVCAGMEMSPELASSAGTEYRMLLNYSLAY